MVCARPYNSTKSVFQCDRVDVVDRVLAQLAAEDEQNASQRAGRKARSVTSGKEIFRRVRAELIHVNAARRMSAEIFIISLSREVIPVDDKLTESMAAAESAQTSMFKFGKERTEATLGIQRELLDTYDQASRDWLARVKSESELWSALAAKLAETRSIPDAMRFYQECVSQRLKMAAEDAQRLSNECGSFMQKINRSLTNGWFPGSR